MERVTSAELVSRRSMNFSSSTDILSDSDAEIGLISSVVFNKFARGARVHQTPPHQTPAETVMFDERTLPATLIYAVNDACCQHPIHITDHLVRELQ